MKFRNGEWIAEENSSEAQSLKNIAKRQVKIDTKKSTPKLSQQSIRETNRQNE